MAPRLVFVHGIGRPCDPKSKLLAWTRALVEGSLAAGHSRFARWLSAAPEGMVVLAYYGDLFSNAGAQGSRIEGIGESELGILTDFIREILEEQLADGPDEEVRDVMERALLQLAPTGQPQGPGQGVRHIIVALTTLLSVRPLRGAGDWAGGKFLLSDLAQVARYLGRGESAPGLPALDERIRARVSEAMGDGPAVVAAHSLGSVVAMETSHLHAADVPLLATFGSPIAMRSVVWTKIDPQPPRTPEPVGRWLNFWDRDDVIVARPRLERDIKPNTAGIVPVSRRVDSNGRWTHSAVKYLRQPAVAGPIAEAAETIGLL
jgi:hypothetical protein